MPVDPAPAEDRVRKPAGTVSAFSLFFSFGISQNRSGKASDSEN